jgi:hypothetical protein
LRLAVLVVLLAALAGQISNPPSKGTWASEGYGLVLEIGDDALETFEVTKVSCIATGTAAAVPAPPGALSAFRLPGRSGTLVLLPDVDPARRRIHPNGTASDVVLRRIERKPAVCDQRTPDTPRSNFDVFAETWAEHYPFFSMKHADWPAIVAANRARITDETTPSELFAVLEGMIAPFEDAHTSLRAPSLDKRFGGRRTSPAWIDWRERDPAHGLVSKYLDGPLRSFCEGQLESGMLEPDVGYLRIRSFSGYHSDGSFESGLAALESALDEIFAGAGSWKGFVIDVRINGGGSDPYGLAIASRLTDRRYLAYSKQARNDPKDETSWTPVQPSFVTPSDRPGFRGRIVELIGIQSVSAAETFTQALLNRRPAIVRVGENTQGVFSDVLGRTLPNGWRFGLPNERFVTDGRSYDGPGIAPDVDVLSFTPEGISSGRDAGIEKALALLSEERGDSRVAWEPR